MQPREQRVASSDSRRARTLVGALTVVLAGASFYAHNAHAEGCGAQSDFLVRQDPLLAAVAPADCARVFQSPPDFTWPTAGGNNTYTVTVTFPDGHSESVATATNWLAWQAALAPGNYTWTVASSGATNKVSSPRSFTVDASAAAFVAPAGDAVVARAESTARPRSWANDAGNPIAAIRAERAAGFAALKRDVDARLADAVTAEPVSASKNANYEDTVTEQKRTLNAALAWAVTKDPTYGADAARRMLAQAAWSTGGAVGFAANDMASRTVAWTLALGYDWCHDYLDAAQKRSIAEAIRARTQAMYDQYIATSAITTYPRDSHGNLTLTITAAIATLMAGEITDAAQWARASVPMAIVWTSPWGGADGGFGNGNAQGIWDLGSNLLAWYVLKNTSGADVSRKEWVRNHGRFLAYFTPAGLSTGVFGDGFEYSMPEQYARMTKAYAAFAPAELSRWHAAQLSGADASRLELLLAPREATAGAAFPAGTAHSAFFPSIGWAAFHSDLRDPARASVYFKSSAYGSFNHSHGDQNSFVVNHKGRRLAINSGYYDDYRTAHWSNWYKQTRSKNAVTYDGGQGQGFNDLAFAGKVTRFEQAEGHDVVSGDAAAAYGSAVTQAQRTMVYLRDINAVVVYDVLASATPRTWEWNIHALERMTRLSDTRVLLANGDARLCVEMLASPQVAFTQHNAFTSAPAGPGMPAQWHGMFATTAKAANAEFVALMRIGSDCGAHAAPAGKRLVANASIERVGSGWVLEIDGKTVALSGDRASVT